MVRKQNVCDVLRVSVPFVQLKKREKHPWRSVTFKPVTLLKVTKLQSSKILSPGLFLPEVP